MARLPGGDGSDDFFSRWELSATVYVHRLCVADVCAFFFSDMRAEEATVPRSHVVCWCIEE